ncbi:FG-nucleoporin nsp1 [Coelomomyces lativittatus]|nr:FG-nucleoporin nsp1 [Coelomomyces lativittatus]
MNTQQQQQQQQQPPTTFGNFTVQTTFGSVASSFNPTSTTNVTPSVFSTPNLPASSTSTTTTHPFPPPTSAATPTPPIFSSSNTNVAPSATNNPSPFAFNFGKPTTTSAFSTSTFSLSTTLGHPQGPPPTSTFGTTAPSSSTPTSTTTTATPPSTSAPVFSTFGNKPITSAAAAAPPPPFTVPFSFGPNNVATNSSDHNSPKPGSALPSTSTFTPSNLGPSFSLPSSIATPSSTSSTISFGNTMASKGTTPLPSSTENSLFKTPSTPLKPFSASTQPGGTASTSTSLSDPPSMINLNTPGPLSLQELSSPGSLFPLPGITPTATPTTTTKADTFSTTSEPSKNTTFTSTPSTTLTNNTTSTSTVTPNTTTSSTLSAKDTTTTTTSTPSSSFTFGNSTSLMMTPTSTENSKTSISSSTVPTRTSTETSSTTLTSKATHLTSPPSTLTTSSSTTSVPSASTASSSTQPPSTSLTSSSSTVAPTTTTTSPPPPSTDVSAPKYPLIAPHKQLEELVNYWNRELAEYTHVFKNQATSLMGMDKEIVTLSHELAKLHTQVTLLTETQKKVDDHLAYLYAQHHEVASLLQVYEKEWMHHAVEEKLGTDGPQNPILASSSSSSSSTTTHTPHPLMSHSPLSSTPSLMSTSGHHEETREKVLECAERMVNEFDVIGHALEQCVETLNQHTQPSSLWSSTSTQGRGLGTAVDGGSISGSSPQAMRDIVHIMHTHLRSLEWIDATVEHMNLQVHAVRQRYAEVERDRARILSSRSDWI